MLSTYRWPRYQAAPLPSHQPRVPLCIVGAGPVGLSLAIDAAQRGLSVLLLDEDNTVSIGSRAVCHAKRTLEIFDRLGVGDAVVQRGVTWNVGRTFHRDSEVFNFNLLPDSGHKRPGMVNLQQYHLEQLLVERALQLPAIHLRWLHKVVDVEHTDAGATLRVQTPDGSYTVECDWLVAADGAKSPIRRRLGLDVEGKVFQDRFLIADVVLDGEPFPADRTERRFWFDPPFHPGQSVLMHREADNVWRIDFQLGWSNEKDADPEAEKQPERVAPRIRHALDSQGFEHIGFQLEWVSVYTFQCRRMAQFRHRRVLFVGDAAHQVSPFGARGGNSGVQDADNLGWKLALVIQGRAPDSLLDSYHAERAAAADDNIANSTRSTDFMTPKSHASRLLRDAVLSLAAEFGFARALVNSGRLSVATVHADSPLNTPDSDVFEGWMVPGAPADDAPLPDGRWLLQALHEHAAGFVLLLFDTEPAVLPVDGLPALLLAPDGPAAQRYDARPGTCYLLRPDQHIAARWRRLDPAAVRAALQRACT